MITIYLAGAIRDDHPEDIEWRERLISRVNKELGYDAYKNIQFLNPLGNKTFNPITKEWRVATIRTNSKGIVGQDLWSVRHSDIVIANFSSLVSGYPTIGTVMEVGAAAGMGGKLVYSVIDPGYSGHTNPGVFTLHPFLKELSTEVFGSEEEMEEFMISHLPTLGGWNPHFGGVVGGE